MARYLNEREVGFDLSTIGFPNIGDCMGVVLQTQNGLYGFHAMPGDAARVSGFAQFIQNSGLMEMLSISMAAASGRNGAVVIRHSGGRR
jgi:hypothetical protein